MNISRANQSGRKRMRGQLLTSQNILESVLDITSIQRRSFNETKSILLGESLGLFRRYGPQMSQIRFVSNEHDDDVGVGVVTKFLEPSSCVDVGLMLRDVVDKETSNRSSVVGGRDGSVTFLSS